VKNSVIFTEEAKTFSLPPRKAIKYCLDSEGIDVNDLDLIVASSSMVYSLERRWRNLTKGAVAQFLPSLKDRKKIIICNHHLSHAASTFWCSPFKKAAILIVDGAGNILKNKKIEHTSIFKGERNGIKLIKRISSSYNKPNSLGYMYSLATIFIGFDSFRESKTMGLAAYGSTDCLKHYDKAVKYLGKGEYRVSPHFQITEDFTIPHGYKKVFGRPRDNGKPLRKLDKNIAFAVQEKLEEILIELCSYAYRQTECTNLCLAGGVALNCTANGKIIENTPFKNIFIQPAASDDGTALGNALYGWHVLLKKRKRFIMKNAYLGRCYSRADIARAVEKWKGWIKYNKSPNIAKQTARLLSKGKIIGWYSGSSEIGPRALGHRSILADPRNPRMKTLLNKKVKHRESFRPFAPSVLNERASEYFHIQSESPFMLMAVRTKQPERIPAVAHVDNSSRIQTVTKKDNGLFYDLIYEFYKITGIPMLLNTSFNDRDEPIVETPYDAIKCFLETHMDYLVIENQIIAKTRKKLLEDTTKYSFYEKYVDRSNEIILAKQGEKKFFYNSADKRHILWSINKRLLEDLSDNEEIVFNLKKGTGYRLGKIELTIWNMADGTKKIREIAEKIYQDYAVKKNNAYKDTYAFIRKMAKEKLLILSNLPKITG